MSRASTLADLGEAQLIDRIVRLARRIEQKGVVLGIGDDAAIVRPRPGEDWVTSTDATVEDVHFRWERESPFHVGRKALVANLSDLAAMGARPLAFTLALAAPPGLELARFDGLLRGLLREAEIHHCPLVGGNLVRARQTSLAIHVLGGLPRGRALRRDSPAPGSAIGRGPSAAGPSGTGRLHRPLRRPAGRPRSAAPRFGPRSRTRAREPAPARGLCPALPGTGRRSARAGPGRRRGLRAALQRPRARGGPTFVGPVGAPAGCAGDSHRDGDSGSGDFGRTPRHAVPSLLTHAASGL